MANSTRLLMPPGEYLIIMEEKTTGKTSSIVIGDKKWCPVDDLLDQPINYTFIPLGPYREARLDS